ncbi:MAG: hypothetical protein HQK50_13150 [Oligoflexia bacterium]|nr:hypothetical protein [Oligoflexia bacterium]MBF0366513.1 hypothetical protein [Oligoflexia bacterium]
MRIQNGNVWAFVYLFLCVFCSLLMFSTVGANAKYEFAVMSDTGQFAPPWKEIGTSFKLNGTTSVLT